jgi:pSer/pThr/pTyr-binding forkhead associated (FHA) protein
MARAAAFLRATHARGAPDLVGRIRRQQAPGARSRFPGVQLRGIGDAARVRGHGTYVNGKLIKKHALTHGDVITIGHHHLRFVDSQVESSEQDEFERTLVIQPGQVSEARLRAATESLSAPAAPSAPQARAAPAAPAPRAAAADKGAPSRAAKLQVLSGQFAGRELELAKTLTTLGRPGVQVAAISRRADGYYVVHVESSKPGDYPLVNGQPIGPQARRLHDNDVVTLAGVKMGFFEA